MTEDVDNAGTAAKARSTPDRRQDAAGHVFRCALSRRFCTVAEVPAVSAASNNSLWVKPALSPANVPFQTEARLTRRVLAPTIDTAKRRLDPAPRKRRQFMPLSQKFEFAT